jgi:hypothetical protein
MKNNFKKSAAFFVASLMFVAISPTAQAQNLEQCVRQTAKCAGSAVEAQLAVLSGAANAIAFTVNHPHCVADIVTGNYVTIGISGAMVALNIKDPYGSAARPLVEQLNKGLPFLPIGGLLTQYGDDALGAAFQSAAQIIPIPSPNPLTATLDGQLGCGSAIAAQGAQLISDVKKVAGSVKKLGQSCGAAASCFAGVLKDIITDPAGAVASAVDWAGDKIDDGLDAINPYACKNQSAASYMATHILPRVNPIAHATVWGNLDYGKESANLYNQCVASYDKCDSGEKDANRRCRAIIAGDGEAQGEAYNKDKGLSQRVARRQLELGIPKQLALEHASVMAAQNYSQRDTAIQKRQLDDLLPEVRERLGVQLVSLGAAQRSIELKKFLGIDKIAADGKFGADQAVVLEGGLGKVLLAQADAETPKNGVGWSFRFGQMYKQYVPDRETLLKAIDQQLEQRLIVQKKAAFDANGEKWNVQIMLERHQKMNKEAQDHVCKYFDECKDKVKLTLVNYGNMVLAAGRKSQFAGLGALGVEHSDYKNYLNTRNFLEASLAQHLTSAQLTFDNLPIEKKLALTGQAPLIGAGGSRGAGVIAAAVPVGTPAASIAAASPGQQFEGAVGTAPKPGTLNAGPVGMPAAPTMGVIALNTGRNPPKADLGAATTGKAPSATPGVAAAVAPPATAAAPPKSVVNLLPFDPAAYRNLREKQIEDEWMPKCAGQAQCLSKVNDITDRLLNAEIAALKSGTPVHTDKAAVTAFQNALDPIFDPQFKDALPKTVMTSSQPAGQLMASNPTPPPKPVVTLLPFDAAAYRTVRDKEIKAEWMPKCGGNAACLQRMNDITDALLKREIAALSAGTPLHTDRIAVIAFQNSLDPIFDPQFKAVIPVVATAPASNGSGAMSNKKPDFSIKIK